VDLALTSYREALDYLFARTTGVSKFGLERTEALLAALGDPHRRMPTLHVAGTNGKGSVCATLEALLRAKGLRVAKYTSPHLVDFRERFIVDGRPVAEDYIVDFIARWTPTIEQIGATFFEATTAMAFDFFQRQAVDIAVIETGLGGRLDSTNVIAPLVAGVTSIGLDHTEILGDTKELIAFEKAGIFKPGRPAIVGEQDRGIRELVASLGRSSGAAPVLIVADACDPRDIRVGGDGTRFVATLGETTRELRTPLAGAHQAFNTCVALLMLDTAGPDYAITLADAARDLERVRLPGRFQRVGRYLFDVAHNADGAAVLATTLRETGPEHPVSCVLCVLGDKDWSRLMSALSGAIDHFVLTNAPTAPASRAWDLGQAFQHARRSGWSAEMVPDFDAALRAGASSGATVVVTGSFHTVGDAMTRLQVDPLAG
jgi:dihydrofolate synthase/folylpolyglutamate synthase